MGRQIGQEIRSERLNRLCIRGGGGVDTERGTRILKNIHSEGALEVLTETGG